MTNCNSSTRKLLALIQPYTSPLQSIMLGRFPGIQQSTRSGARLKMDPRDKLEDDAVEYAASEASYFNASFAFFNRVA